VRDVLVMFCMVTIRVVVSKEKLSLVNRTVRFREHEYAFKTNSHMSNCAKHILEQSHSFGPIQDTMQILQYQNKGNHLNTIERFYIYTEFIKDNHLNDEHNKSPNRIFDALLKPQ